MQISKLFILSTSLAANGAATRHAAATTSRVAAATTSHVAAATSHAAAGIACIYIDIQTLSTLSFD